MPIGTKSHSSALVCGRVHRAGPQRSSCFQALQRDIPWSRGRAWKRGARACAGCPASPLQRLGLRTLERRLVMECGDLSFGLPTLGVGFRPIPKGLSYKAQGCEFASYPGWGVEKGFNPNGVAAGAGDPSATPLELTAWWRRFPRVARASQPLGLAPESLWDSAHGRARPWPARAARPRQGPER